MFFPILQDFPLVEEAGQVRCEVGEKEIEKLSEVSDYEPKDRVNEDGEASTATETKAEDEPKASKEAENA